MIYIENKSLYGIQCFVFWDFVLDLYFYLVLVYDGFYGCMYSLLI